MISLNITPTSASAGGGIDVTSVVNQILDSERGPERIWQSQQATLTLQSTALNVINSDLTALEDKVNGLKDVLGALNTKSVTSSDQSILSATADTTAVSGTHVVVVNSLATTSSYYSDALAASSTTLGDGTLSLKVGAGDTVSVAIDAAHNSNTLDKLASYINSQNLGVTASVITDASGARLALVSKTSGQAGDLTASSTVPGLAMHKSITGGNASLTIDGVPISSASNTVTGALAGVTLSLAGYDPYSEVQVNVGPDIAQAKQAVKDFADAYNLLISAINVQYSVDPTTYVAGPLASDAVLGVLQSSLLTDVSYTLPHAENEVVNNGIMSLWSIGVEMQNDGTLLVDDTKLTNLLNTQYTDFQNFFQALDTGFANHFGTDLIALTDSTEGPIAVDLAQIDSTQKMLTDSISAFEDHLAQREQLLIIQYSQVDAALRQFPLMMQQITSLLATLSTSTTTS